MAKKSPEPSPPSDYILVARWLGRILLFGALGISLYLGIKSITNGPIAGCAEGGGCNEVLSSKWGYFFGVPVSIFGALTYLTLLGSDFRGCCRRLHAICRWMILGAALWFVCVQVFILGQFCPWCCVTHTLASLGALCLWKRPLAKTHFVDHPAFAPALSVAALASLAAVQSFGPERATTTGTSLAQGQGTKIVEPKTEGPRMISLHGGKFTLNAKEFPAIGDAQTAKNVAVGLFDFTCPHCRHLTETLTKIQEEFGSQLAVVQLPGHFNPKGETIQKLLLPVWREDPETYYQLADLLHEGSLAAKETEVRAAIGSFVETEVHAKWMLKHEPWSSHVLKSSQIIRETNRKLIKTGKFPQLMIGDYVEAGSKSNPGHYYQLFKEKFGITRDAIPKLTVAPASLALGDIHVGAPNVYTLKLKNPGGPTVHLSRPKLVRGMRLKKAHAMELASGEETTLEIEVTPPTPGAIKGNIEILSDAEPAVVRVPVEANAIPVYQANPSLANLGMYRGKPLTKKVDLSFIAPVQLGTPRPNNPKEFRVSSREIEPGLRYELTITATPQTSRAGLHQTSISIPLQPKSASKPWPRQIRLAARCQVPGSKPGPRRVTPTPRASTSSIPQAPNRIPVKQQ